MSLAKTLSLSNSVLASTELLRLTCDWDYPKASVQRKGTVDGLTVGYLV